MKLDRNAIFAKGKNRRTKDVTIPEWGEITVRELSAKEVSEYVKAHKEGRDELDSLVSLVAMSAIDDSGNVLFSQADLQQLKELPFNVLKPIADAVANLAGLDDDTTAKKN